MGATVINAFTSNYYYVFTSTQCAPNFTHCSKSRRELAIRWKRWLDLIFGEPNLRLIYFVPRHYVPVLLELYQRFIPRWSALRWKAKT